MSYRVARPLGVDEANVLSPPPAEPVATGALQKAIPWLLGIGLAATVLVLSSELKPFAAR